MRPQHFKLAAGILWLALLSVAFFTAPPSAPDTADVIVKMATGKLDGVNLSLFGLFNLMGTWPFAVMVALRFDRPWWKWPFLLGSFVLGAFVLLPYLVLRPWLLPHVEPRDLLGRVLGNRWVRYAVVLAFVVFGGFFLLGDLKGFGVLFRTQQFPYVMTFDFFACCGVGVLLGLERRLAP